MCCAYQVILHIIDMVCVYVIVGSDKYEYRKSQAESVNVVCHTYIVNKSDIHFVMKHIKRYSGLELYWQFSRFRRTHTHMH